MGLTQKILLFTSALVIALVATSLAFTTWQADRLAHESISAGLSETRGVWETFQSDRYSKLKLGVRVLANDPYFKAAVETNDYATVFDLLEERGKDVTADFFLATDPSGTLVARSDKPGAQGDDLSKDPVVMKPLDGEEASTVWRQGDRLFHAVAVPMRTGSELKGVLVAGYGINEALASQIQKLTHSDIAYVTYPEGQPPLLSVSSLGQREQAFRDSLSDPRLAANADGSDTPFPMQLGRDDYMAVQVPLRSATREVVGAAIALRSVSAEMAAFNRFRNSLVMISLVVMVLGLGVAYLTASRITGPVRHLVDVVERARSGSYSGSVELDSRDEIGTLARSFNSLLADLREKEQMIGFLRDGMTMMRKGAGVTGTVAGTTLGSQETTSVTIPGAVRVNRGDLFAGRYEVRGTLGKGGMGVVYRAHDRQLDEEVALKVLRPDVMRDDPTLLERFKLEIKLARRITHRNVLRTHDFGETEDGAPYISMEYLEGVTLKDLVVNKGALPVGVGLRIAKQMSQGLEAAHAMGVVHRDIKPQNMLILPESGEVKIMDFGIARVTETKGQAGSGSSSGLTTAGTVMGTPDYMSPEQAQGMGADFRSDIYSLGVVLFEIFSGTLPFTGETIMKVVLAQIQTPAPSPRSVNPRISPELETVILKCLHKDPDHRYQAVGDLLDDLTSVSSHVEAA